MIQLLDPPTPPQQRQEGAPRALPLSRCILATILLALGVATLFCHGCHAGDHDDELIIWFFDRSR